MDLLAKRWANPFLMLDEFIRLNQLHEMLVETIQSIAEEQIRKNRWDYYIHRVCQSTDMSFEDYVQYCEEHQHSNSEEMTNDEIGSVIGDSKKLLELFQVERG